MERVQNEQRKRGSERDLPGPTPEGNDLKFARSKAEVVRVWQGYAMIFLGFTNIILTVAIYLSR